MKSSNQFSKKSAKPTNQRPAPSKNSSPAKAQNTKPKETPQPDKSQDSISESMRSTPTTAQMISSFPNPLSLHNLENNLKRPGPVKIPTFEFIPSSPSPLSGKTPDCEPFLRRDSRSLTTVNTPHELANKELKKTAENARRTVRTKTDMHKAFHNYSNSLSDTFNNGEVGSKGTQKSRKFQKSEIVMKNKKTNQEDTEKLGYGSFVKGRSGVASSASMSSFGFNEAQLEILNDLARNVKELNQRLIKSEEVTYERLKENLALKNKIKNLENRIEIQEGGRLENEGIKAGCSGGCLVF